MTGFQLIPLKERQGTQVENAAKKCCTLCCLKNTYIIYELTGGESDWKLSNAIITSRFIHITEYS